MPELPKSWGLKTQKRADGKLDIMGKTDAGEDYRVRTTDHDYVSDTDIAELHAADRETYTSREAGARAFCSSLCPKKEDVPVIDQAMGFDDYEWIEAAKPVVAAGFGTKTFGSTRAFRRNWDRVFKEN